MKLHLNLPGIPAVRIIQRAAGALVLASLFSAPLMAAEVRAPLQALRHPNYSLIVAERLDQPAAAGKMAVRVIERLRGDPEVEDEIELLVQKGDADRLELGRAYLLFYSDIVRANFKARTEVRRPDRRELLHIEGADPAVFPDTPAMRALLDPAHAEVEQSPGYREIVLEGMRSDDPGMVDLWTAEWALRPQTFLRLKAEEAELLQVIAEDPEQRPAARARILLAGQDRTAPEAGGWYAASAAVVLGQTNPAQLTESAGLSQLIYACLRVARDNPDSQNVPRLDKWLKAVPPLAENAALALRAIDPEIEREAVQSAIADEGTPEPTRTFLADHLRRLELAGDRS